MVQKEVGIIKHQISQLRPVEVTTDSSVFVVTHSLHLTMIDGKIGGILTGNNVEQVNLSDILSSIDQKDVIYLEGHENRVSVLAWFSKKCLLASSGFDGTVRVWTYDCKPQLCLEHTFVFHESMNVYGTELQGKLIGHIKWSPTGDYIAAAMENIINIWPVSMSNEETDGCKEWFIDDQHEFVTCMTWPKYKHEDVNKKDYLLVGRIDGTVSLISVYRGNKEVETLINCSLSHAVVKIDWHHEDELFAIAFIDGTIKLGRICQNSDIITVKAHDNAIIALKWDFRGTLLATASVDMTCKVWQEQQGKLQMLHSFVQPHEPVSLEWSPLIEETNTPLLLAIGRHGSENG
ncbi:hypothetical protein ILUMI_09771 [Ignelater luminosus]|uniref:Anaphase-promoting complex subunit 4-like WD40 domain-containing protein n=1 Tax=Ignelater luminosus TaxID=2038154 RepID=A0A8K0CZ48_IGNLU|nr:hypothetical protein ILUMI_09771 [Ignelater luminosus]